MVNDKPECFGNCNSECYAEKKYEGLSCFDACFEELKRKERLNESHEKAKKLLSSKASLKVEG